MAQPGVSANPKRHSLEEAVKGKDLQKKNIIPKTYQKTTTTTTKQIQSKTQTRQKDSNQLDKQRKIKVTKFIWYP